ncbi:MAG: DUF3644 domain-containing protein [Bacilli bacterium]|nr:DUF3644 domain-containing protein [Bacilli bacterium]
MQNRTSYKLLNKSLSAALLAIEIYNKPNIEYREESFSILIINAYELLFKSKIIFDTNDIRSIYIYDKRKLNNGTLSKRKYIRKNDIGEPLTIGIQTLIDSLYGQKVISLNLYENLKLLIEIRDNSIHFLNDNSMLKYKLYTVCIAAVKNFYRLIENWFPSFDLSKYNFFITPINFDSFVENIEPVNLEVAQKNFINYIDLTSSVADEADDYNICVKLDLKFTKVSSNADLLIQYATEGKPINVELNDAMFKKMYPLDYKKMVKIVKEKYNLKINPSFNKVKSILQTNETCCKARYLDPEKKGTPRYYYNPNFINKIYEQIKREN